ncbi:MAG: glycoside hydrolase family 2 protein [Bacteroidales bacterium]
MISEIAFAKSSLLELPISTGWEMRETTSNDWLSAVVPGCVHSDLLLNKQIPKPYFQTNEKQLQWIDKKDWEYKTTFDVSDEVLFNEHIELVFKGLDTYATVYLNEKEMLKADNMFREWTIEAKQSIRVGSNSLRIVFNSPINIGLELLKENGFILKATNDQAENGGLTKDQLVSPFIRKAPYHFGWDWGPRFVTSGIWQPVFLRAWNAVKISNFYVQQQSLNDKLATLKGQIEIKSSKNQQAEVSILINGKKIAKQYYSLSIGTNTIDFPFDIKNPKRWWTNGLGKANLYSISVQVESGNSSDSESRQIGLRTLRLIQKPDSVGRSFYFELNGVPVFAKGANHIPNDMFLDKVTKDVYDREIETASKSNFNMLRVWGGGIYENDYFYELCDRNGILVWQDFMFACSLYPGNKKFLNSVTQEAAYQLKRLRNHACIALWCGNNEIDVAWQNFEPNGGWGWKKSYTELQKKQIWSAYDTIFNHILANAVKDYSSQTPYWQSSPSSIISKKHASNTNKSGDVHYWEVWHGKKPFENYALNIGRFMSEYGFQSFPELETVKKYALPEDYDIESEVMRHHQRSAIGNVTIKDYMDRYYQKPLDFEKFLYVGQVLQANGIQYAVEAHRRAMPYNMGSLVWQINDCWPVASWSSTDYYRRWKALQYELKRSFEPILISAYTKTDSTYVTVVSDKLKDINALFEMNVCDFSGKVIRSKTIKVNVKANHSTTAFKDLTANLTANVNGNYFSFKLKNRNELIADKIYFLTYPKSLQLDKPQIMSNIRKKNNTWIIRLKTNVLAKNVYLNFKDVEGFFSDNYFDLVPGIEKNITFKSKLNISATQKLEISSLVDSYK